LQPIKFGVRVLENKEKEKEHSHENNMPKWCITKQKKKQKIENRMKKGQDIEEPCPNCYK